jgi:phosphoribosylanthranilate isomerase
MRVRVKICGVTTPEAVAAVVEAGADALGFVLAASPRQLTIDAAGRLCGLVPPFVSRVVVLRHPGAAAVRDLIAALRPDLVQAEPGPGIDAARAAGVGVIQVLHDAPGIEDRLSDDRLPGGPGVLLLEAAGRGGRGVAPDWDRAAVIARRAPLVLAGGLTPENVGAAIRTVRPYAVDVSSGVESAPGRKDPERIARFLAAVRRAGDEMGDIPTRLAHRPHHQEEG